MKLVLVIMSFGFLLMGSAVGQNASSNQAEYAQFLGWDSVQVATDGQTFHDVFGDGSGVDVHVSLTGDYDVWPSRYNSPSYCYARGCATILPYFDSRNQKVTTGGRYQTNQMIFSLNRDDIGGQLFVETDSLDDLEALEAVAFDGGPLRFEQTLPTGWVADVVNNSTNAPEIRGTGYGNDANHGLFVFSNPSTFSVTYATEKPAGYQSYRVGRVAEGLGANAGAEEMLDATEFAHFSGWDDAKIRNGGQRFLDVFGDGKLNVLVESRGTYGANLTNDRRIQTATEFESHSSEIRTSGANEWNELVFKLEPLSFDIGGELVVASDDTDASERLRVAALGDATVDFHEATSGERAVVFGRSHSKVELQGSGFGRDASDGVFLIGTPSDASSFQLAYTSFKYEGWQEYRIGRIPVAQDPASSSSFVSVPEPNAQLLTMAGILLLHAGIRRRRGAHV